MEVGKAFVDGLNILKTLAEIMGAILIPLAVVYVGARLREREAIPKYLEMAVAVLSEEKASPVLKSWAWTVLRTYTPVPIPADLPDLTVDDRQAFSKALRPRSGTGL